MTIAAIPAAVAVDDSKGNDGGSASVRPFITFDILKERETELS